MIYILKSRIVGRARLKLLTNTMFHLVCGAFVEPPSGLEEVHDVY